MVVLVYLLYLIDQLSTASVKCLHSPALSYLLTLCTTPIFFVHHSLTQGKNANPTPLGWKGHLGFIYSDLSVALSKESGGTQLAPPDPIFYTQAVKNNPSIQCLATKEIFKLAEYFPCGSRGPAHLPIHLLNQGLLKARGARSIYPLVSGN